MQDLIQNGILIPALVVFLISGFVQGLAGFGLALIGVPLLTFYVLPQISVPLVTMLTVPVSGLMLYQLHKEIDWTRALWLGIPTVLLAPAGVYLLKALTEAQLSLGIGVVLIGSALYSALRTAQVRRQSATLDLAPTPVPVAPAAVPATVDGGGGAAPTPAPAAVVPTKNTPVKLVVIGCFSGVLGGAIGMNGPLIADYLNKSGIRPNGFKVTLNLIFFVSAVTRIGLYFAQGVMQERSLWLALVCTPVAVVASFFGGYFTRRIEPKTFAKIINAYLVLIGFWLLYQGVNGIQAEKNPAPNTPKVTPAAAAVDAHGV